ncbi:hypothetical protein T440DRAFT_503864 [Plenodomus tracheiphilus IPT5]|uniref:Uncharacterized protein n=1 Tax=Plenodomus tracheiphilus IPT5 TaxID=1408161 RepID=A0A6A7BLA6_9PLEO|nr:hypothetical protein T440DRAFT_503864 [Plenodomus tracheiphilus IPT5]
MKLAVTLGLLTAATTVHANNGVPDNDFRDYNGIRAAVAGAPMWHFASGSCLPSAAEDGQGHQTNGVNPGADCAVGAYLGNGCPGDSTWRGSSNVWYHDPPGEPFGNIPTYFKVQQCGDGNWRIYYGVYFKKDVGHKSDWEWAVMKWVRGGDNKWYRQGVVLQVDNTWGGGYYGGIPNTFDNSNDQFQDGNRNRDHPKLYFGKHHHAVHWDMYGGNKNTCGAGSDDFRANDFQFWSSSNLRDIGWINPSWNYGAATNPHNVDLCDDHGKYN